MPVRFRTFDQQIYAGGAPSAEDLKYMKDILGVKTVLSLDATVGSQIAPILKQLKIKHINNPINPGSSTIDESIRYLQKNIVNILTNYQPIYVHCLYGRDRTGFALMIYRVLKNHWSFSQAFSEARKYGYGDGISLQTQTLWKNFLLALKIDSNANQDEDIVSYMRNTFNFGDVPPAFNSQQSFAPKSDVNPSLYHDDERWIRAQERNKDWEQLINDKIPIVGQPTMNGPINGFGPVENSSGFLSLL